MKRVVDAKGRKETYFMTFNLEGSDFCPNCKRQLKERDRKILEMNSRLTCPKCMNTLIK